MKEDKSAECFLKFDPTPLEELSYRIRFAFPFFFGRIVGN